MNTRELVEDLQRRYVTQIDDGELEGWPEFFTEDGHYQIISKEALDAGQVIGFYVCTGKGMLADRILTLRKTAIYEPQSYRHMISATMIEHESDGVIIASTNFMVVRTTQDGDMTVFSAGRYRDTIVMDKDELLFKEKLVVTDSNKMDTLLAIPI